MIRYGYPKGGDEIEKNNRDANTRKNQYRIRLTDEEVKILDECSEKLKMTKASIIRKGINMVYEETKK